jgi:DNA-binding NtrC family response regulator
VFIAANRPIVLIVEDEFLLRMDASEMIEGAGFETVEAGNAEEAIAILERRSDISVVFTDVQMPGSMDGLKLAAAVRGRWPPIQIIATSGCYFLRQGDLPDGALFLPTPYTSERISILLHELTGYV